MKRTAVMLLILCGITIPSLAVKRVTIAQLEQLINTFRGKQDSDLAYQIADAQLTERLSTDRVARMSASLPGDKSRQALTAVAAASEFQYPPAAEIQATAAPDLAGQRRIMGLVADYVTKTIPLLPNFLATRTTTRFEDTPLLQRPGEFFVPYEPLHFVGASGVTVLYRNGRELEEMAAKTPKTTARGLDTWGEFGPILATILLDAAQNKLAWSHWERGPEGLQAVFSYEVVREKSHYEVNYCCIAEEGATVGANVYPFRKIVGYRGEMAVDPSSGTILRLSVEAALKPDSPVSRADILVEYGSVEIGGKSYICPVKSASITTAQMVQKDEVYDRPMARHVQPLKTMLNNVKFENYHVFRAESRVLTADAEQDRAAPPTTPQAAATAPPAGFAAAAASETTTASAHQPSAPEASTAAPSSSSAAATTAPAPTTPTPQAASPEISETGSADVPNTPANPPSAAALGSGFTLRTTTQLVDVSLVAYDKKGHPVTDLKQSDFEIYDNGRKQEIKNFEQAGHSVVASGPSPESANPSGAEPEPLYSNRQTDPVFKQRPATTENHVTILLIDASNLAWGDLQYARQEMLRFLNGLPGGEQVGLYILRSYGFQVILGPTGDHAEVAAQLSRWMPTAQDLSRAQDEEKRNRQQLEYVHSLADLAYVNGNALTRDFDAYGSIDPQLRSLGSAPQRDALVMLSWIARHLATIAGHKSLVWVSSDNVLADWSDKAPTVEKGNKYIEPFALRAQEALNEAHVSIYPLNASQLEAGGISASLPQGNVQLNPTAAPEVEMGIVRRESIAKAEELGEMLEKSKHDIYPGRMTAQMQQDTHPIQGEFRELAEATGGRALRRAGDIAAELNGIAEDGRAGYLLSFTPDGPADDEYHLITVKLAGRRDLTLHYRTGYLYEKEPATLKQRFQQAVWQPRDVNDVGITATPAGSGKDRTLTLNIAATDLEMAQLDDLRTDKLDIFVIDRDDSALRAKFTSRTLSLQLRAATYQKVLREGIPVEQPLPARQTGGSVRILVVDENSGRMGSVTLPNDLSL